MLSLALIYIYYHVLTQIYLCTMPTHKKILAGVLIYPLMDQNINANLATIALDNCTTNNTLILELNDKLQVYYFILNGVLIHIRCCAHSLNIIVKDEIEVFKSRIIIVFKSIYYQTTSPKRDTKFEKITCYVCIPITKKLSLGSQRYIFPT